MSKRLSVILGDADQERLEPFLAEGSEERDVLRRWAARRDAGGVDSEAAVIRALLRAGTEALRDHVLDLGYAALALEYDSGGGDADRRAARDRYIERTEASRAPQ
ncbi:MAG: hypothetical protein ACRDSS_12045 [Actinocrinis sp.]